MSVAESQRDEALAQLKEYKAEVRILTRSLVCVVISVLDFTEIMFRSDGNKAGCDCGAS